MPPRRVGPKALAAQGKAKATSRRKGAAASQQPEVDLIAEQPHADEEATAPDKGSKAWSLQRDIDRILKGKLGFVDPLELKSRRNSKGISVTKALEEALLENQAKSGSGGRRQYLTGAFWVRFFEDFGLKNQVSTDCDRFRRRS